VAMWTLQHPNPAPVVRFGYELPEGQLFQATGRPVVTLSADGRHFLYNAAQGLFLRSMGELDARLIPGTAFQLVSPVLSPDGEWVAFFADGQLRKVAVSGGAPVTLCDAVIPFGMSWGADGTILFGQPAGIMRVSASGGAPVLLVAAEEGEVLDGPQMLPDGRAILFTSARVIGGTRWDQGEVVAQPLPSGERIVVLRGGSDARYVPTGHLLYALGSVLYAVPFDAARLEVRGGPVPVLEGLQRAVNPAVNTSAANYGISATGTLVYVQGSAAVAETDRVLAWSDRNGGLTPLGLPPRRYVSPRLSPDGTRVAVETLEANGQSVIWVYDVAGGSAMRRLTQEGSNTRPLWTPDGTRLVFGSDRENGQGLFWQQADGSGVAERLTTAEQGTNHVPESWSPDGQVLSFARIPAGGGDWSIWTLAPDGDRTPQLFYDAPGNQFGSVFSPDGQWLAYADNESGPFGIYVQPFPPTGAKYEITQTGGAWPVWSRDGRELFYRQSLITATEQRMNVVDIVTTPGFAFSNERTLPLHNFMVFQNYRDYDVAVDGQRLLVLVPAEARSAAAPARPRIQVVLNWFDELSRRVPVP
jgi:eukaryotic-like serine/threonine-protein kinase